jgi:hypothetical protein
MGAHSQARRSLRVAACVSAAIGTAAAILGVSAAFAASPTPFFNGFESDTHGWDVYGGQYDATRVASGTNGVTSKTGSFHAEGDIAATDWGNSDSDSFPAGGYTTSVDVYL